MTILDRYKAAVSSFSVAGRMSGAFFLVDDDPDCLKVLTSYTKHAFPHSMILSASNVMDALRVVDQVGAKELRCAIIDWHLPMGSGATIIERLHDDDPGLPILAYTGDSDALEVMAERYPYVHRMQKPGWEYVYSSLVGGEMPQELRRVANFG